MKVTSIRPLCGSLTALFALSFAASSVRADVVTPDDAVIQGSLSVGLDSVDNESFGFDTIRLKENNCRLSFIDTSASASFPNNDWSIVANDSFSGGRNYLGFRDKGPDGGNGDETGTLSFYVMAGAKDSALMVDSSSRIGLGTATPTLKLHLFDGNTPAIRLEQDSSSGYTAQTWDIGANEANFFVRDLTGGSRLPFRIRPGAPTSSIDIAATGSVGIGTASPLEKAKLHVVVNKTSNEGVLITGTTSTVTAPVATLHVDGTAFIAQTLEIGSSRERKENIVDLELADAEKILSELTPVHFNYKSSTQHQMGFIAEDVPDMVATQSRKSLVPMDFVAVLTKVVQKHESRERELQATVNSQQELLRSLAARLEALEGGKKTSAATVTAAPAPSPETIAAKAYAASLREKRRDPVAPESTQVAPPPVVSPSVASSASFTVNDGR